MNCKHCNKKIDDDSKFCEYCGKKQPNSIKYTKGNLEPFQKGSLWGLKDKDTRDIIISPQYNSIGNFVEDRAIVKKNSLFGFIDQNGHEITPPKYDEVEKFINGLAKVKLDQKWALINLDGEEITPIKYNIIEDFKDKYARVQCDGLWSLINRKGKELFPFKYLQISDQFDSVLKVESIKHKFGLIDGDGKELLQCEYDHIGEFKNGLADIKKDSKYGLINEVGEIVLPCEHISIENFIDGFAQILKDGKYGLIDESGKVLVECSYDYINEFKDEIAEVKIGKSSGVINKNGEEIITCKFTKLKIINDKFIVVKKKRKWILFETSGSLLKQTDPFYKRFYRKRRLLKIADSILILIFIIILLSVYDYNTNNIGLNYKIEVLVYGEDETDWKRSNRNWWYGDPSSLEHYINKHPRGKYTDNAKDLILWCKARQDPSEKSYKKYLSTFPNGIKAKWTREVIDAITWDRAKSVNTIKLYEYYISQYPNGQYIKEAGERIEIIDWKTAKNLNNSISYTKYIDIYPNGLYINQALQNLKIQGEWNSLKSKINSKNGLEILYKTFPNKAVIRGNGVFEIWTKDQTKITGTYSYYRYNRREKWSKIKHYPNSVRGDNFCDAIIKCNILGYSKTIEYHGSAPGRPHIQKGKCGPVIFELNDKWLNNYFKITQINLP